MSNFLAIATATETLRQIIEDAVKVDVTGASAKNVRPDAPANELPNPGVNVYLYQVTPNAAWRNADVPTRRPNGDVIQHPRAAIDLHYLLSFYGDENQLETQRLLGSTIRALHEQPVLSRQKIRDAIKSVAFLATSDLDEEVELVKFTPTPFNLEELSKLWSVFFQKAYALSVVYQGTVILLEGKGTPRPTLPVRQRNLYVVTFRQPLIEQVTAAPDPSQPIVANSLVRITGAQLRGDVTTVQFGDIEVTPPASQVSDSQIEVTLPADLRAGVQSLRVAQPRLMGTPPVAHSGVESNIAPFVLRPTITVAVNNIVSSTVNSVTVHAADVTVTFTPNVAVGQRAVLLLNEFQTAPSTTARAYRFDAPTWRSLLLLSGVDETATLTFAVANVIPGAYVVRVQVDGAESLLSQDADGRYNAPQVTI